MNGCAPGLALIERLKATRKWAIHTHSFQSNRFPQDLEPTIYWKLSSLDDVASCFNTSVNSDARDCSAFPAGDSGQA